MSRNIIAVALAAALADCIGSSPDDPFDDVLRGTWSACATEGGVDVSERLTFADDSRLEWTVTRHATADASCGDAGTVASHLSGWFTVGDLMEAKLAGATVRARGLDVTDPDRSFFTTLYVDEAATPRLLYLGVADPASGRDMSSGAKRPIVLGTEPFVLR